MIESNTTSVGAIILAAGASSRMGSPKQLLRFQNTSLLGHAALAALGAGCFPVVVVTGSNAELSRRELDGLNVLEVLNPYWDTGMASSICAGVEGLIGADVNVDAAVFMVCDQPYVTAEVISGLIESHRTTRKSVVASSYAGSFGVPALFDRTLFTELMQLEGKSGAKKIIERHAAKAEFLPFPGGAMDVDTPGDFSRLTGEQVSKGYDKDV